MIEDFHGSRMTSLGPGFVRTLNRHMVTSRHCICLIAEQHGRVLGAAAAVTSTRKFFREFVVRKGLVCALLVLPRLLSTANIRTLLKGFTYFPNAPTDDPDAELISFVVSAHRTRAGVGAALFRGVVEGLQSRGITCMKIITSDENDASNAFYTRQGCQLVRTEPFYRDTRANVYVYAGP